MCQSDFGAGLMRSVESRGEQPVEEPVAQAARLWFLTRNVEQASRLLYVFQQAAQRSGRRLASNSNGLLLLET